MRCQKIRKPRLRNKTRETHWQERAKANYHDIFTGKKPQMADVIITENLKLEPQNTIFQLSDWPKIRKFNNTVLAKVCNRYSHISADNSMSIQDNEAVSIKIINVKFQTISFPGLYISDTYVQVLKNTI